jgi:hypothetical protein
MQAPSNSEVPQDTAEQSRACLPHNPLKAFRIMTLLPDTSERQHLGILIARCWARQDITAAWNAVARSPLSATEKQLIFNELWR